jgi:DNA-binding PadR family transcriptional regulator
MIRATPTAFEAALLGLLAPGPASGYELRKIFQTTPLAVYSDSPGAVYPALQRLHRRGFIKGRPAPTGRRRTPWQLTPPGRAWLRTWIAQPVMATDLAYDAATLDLRLALVSNVTPARLPSFLREYAAAVDGYRASLRRAAEQLGGRLPPSAALALDLGLHLTRARQQWSQRAARRLAR